MCRRADCLRRLQAFQKVLDHSGIPDLAPVTPDLVNLEDKAFVREQEPEPDFAAQARSYPPQTPAYNEGI